MGYKDERMRMGITIILTCLMVELLVFGGFGIAVPIVVAAFYIGVIFLYKSKGPVSLIFKDKLFIPIILLALSFSIFSNELLKFFNCVFLAALMVLQLGGLFERNTYERYSVKWFWHAGMLALTMPFQNWGIGLKSIKQDEELVSSKKMQLVGKIGIGCLIGIPILLIAGNLLIGADAAFEGMMDLIIRNLYIDVDVEDIVLRIVSFTIIFFPLMGFLYGLTHEKKEESRGCGLDKREAWSLDGEIDNEVPATQYERGLDFTIVMTVSTLLGMLYLLYCFAQLSYFVSAFQSILPESYTYAEYARRGFFEMLPIACLNLGVIEGITLFTKGRGEAKKRKWMKGYTFFFIGFTLFIIVTALSKMAMYMNNYGLTLKRIYVTWFLVLCILVLGLITLKICREKVRLCKSLFIIFTVMYLGLNYMNPDYQVARHNADLYLEKGEDTVDDFYGLSLSAVGPLLDMQRVENDDYEYCVRNYEERVNFVSKWQQWNLSYAHAAQLFKERNPTNQ